MLDVDHERSRGTVSKNLKWRHEKPTVRCKLHAGTITQRSLILKMPWSKKKKKCKEWRGVHPGASAQISPKPQHLRAGGFQQTRKARLDHQRCGSVLRRAFRVCSWAACMYSWEWNFNYLDASITFLGPTGDQGPTPPHTLPSGATGRQVNRVHVSLPSKLGVFQWGRKSKSLFQKILWGGKKKKCMKTLSDMISRLVWDLKPENVGLYIYRKSIKSS